VPSLSNNLLNEGNGVFTDGTDKVYKPLPTGNGIDVEAADYTGDGLIDIYLTGFQRTDYLYEAVSNIIPVELSSFTASASKNSVTLNWITATELNNLGFEIQRLSIGDVWEKIVFVEGYGTTTEIHNYSYIDVNLTPGKYLYRLKQIDFDGQFEYSDVVEVDNIVVIENGVPVGILDIQDLMI